MAEKQRFVKQFRADTIADIENYINDWVKQNKNVVIVHTSLAIYASTNYKALPYALVTYYLQTED